MTWKFYRNRTTLTSQSLVNVFGLNWNNSLLVQLYPFQFDSFLKATQLTVLTPEKYQIISLLSANVRCKKRELNISKNIFGTIWFSNETHKPTHSLASKWDVADAEQRHLQFSESTRFSDKKKLTCWSLKLSHVWRINSTSASESFFRSYYGHVYTNVWHVY